MFSAATKKSLRIAIAARGRFHLLDVARELSLLGHDVKFYSLVPKARSIRFGLPVECHVSLLPLMAPMVAWELFFPNYRPAVRERFSTLTLNRAVIARLQPCDVFMCMSGVYFEAAVYARRRYNARIYLHRGSQHICSQDEILSLIPGAERPTKFMIHRELDGYKLADRIAIPSSHVKVSFERDPYSFEKLFQNTYGVDLSMFPYRGNKAVRGKFVFVFVGGWSRRKGCDLLSEAVKRVGHIQLRHVGPIVDLPFPRDDPMFEHIPSVPQWRLPAFYAPADALVHASYEEGLSNVITQALASGLPVICTDRTGGADLAHTPALAARITVVPHGDVDALATAMTVLRDRLSCGEHLPPLTVADREHLSWSSYAKRYVDRLRDDFSQS
jgi:glycosyltransferase involved in cell wall biosynthesis